MQAGLPGIADRQKLYRKTRYKCQDKYAQKFSYKYVQFILLSILSRFLGKGAEADKIFLLL